MSKIMAIVCGLFLFSTAASAQRFNAFVGYSHIGFGPNLYSLQLDPLSPPLRRSKNGWNASLPLFPASLAGPSRCHSDAVSRRLLRTVGAEFGEQPSTVDRLSASFLKAPQCPDVCLLESC